MNRRGFLGALAGATAVLTGGLSWLATREGNAGSSSAPRREGLAGLTDRLNEYLGPLYDVHVSLHKVDDGRAITGFVQSNSSLHHAQFRVGVYRQKFLTPEARDRQVVRQIKYQAKKSAEAVAFTRRTGYVLKFVEREDHRLSGRMYYQHERTGRIRWSVPA